MEAKIAEIVHEAFTSRDEECRIWTKDNPCPTPFEGCEPCIVSRILTLIQPVNDRAERVCKNCLRPYESHSLCLVCETKLQDDAFDKGFETGKMEGAILATKDRAGLVLALGLARNLLEDGGYTPKNSSVIREIDKALEVGK